MLHAPITTAVPTTASCFDPLPALGIEAGAGDGAARAPQVHGLYGTMLGAAVPITAAAMVIGWRHEPIAAAALVAAVLALVLAATRIARILHEQDETIVRLNRQCDGVALLLREYEEHGLGWLWQTDAHNHLCYSSPGLAQMLGLARAALVGRPLPALLGAEARLGRALVARESFNALEFKLELPSGTRWISLAGNPITDADHRFHGFRGTGSDITAWRNSQARLTEMASSDVLTGLPNRQKLRALLASALEDATRDGRPCAVMFLDLDGFKPINDSFGHARGDAVLRAVATRLTAALGELGVVGRMGGDEFAVVLRSATGRPEIDALGRRLIEAIAEPYNLEGAEIRVGVSIGCAVGPLDAETVDDMFGCADMALYLAKAEGRGTVRHFEAAMQTRADDRLRLEQDLKRAIELGQFEVYYQPLVRAASREVAGFEALLRWHHPERGYVSPAVFVPLAEETGMICRIGEWVLRRACRDAATWPDHVTIAVNVSAHQLVQSTLPGIVSDALYAARLPANRLEIEVTESVFLDDSAGALDALRRVRALGVGIALDDFGTGYSSLGYLNKTIFHKLKIDGSFVRDSAKKSESVAIIRAIVDLANSFRMTIVAEGIERTEDFTRMRELGCDQMQGYLFGKPAPFEVATGIVGTRWNHVPAAAD